MAFVRLLHVKLDEATKDVPVTLSTPTESRGTWTCIYEIAFPEGTHADAIGGIDPIQALYLAMEAVALALYASPHHKAGRLYWEKSGDGYGFPMPRAGRKDLVGEDKIAQG
jgi:hypothetical protein